MFDIEQPEEENEHKYQDVGGFKVKVPGRADEMESTGERAQEIPQPPQQPEPAAAPQAPAQPEQQPRPSLGQRIASSGDGAPAPTVPGSANPNGGTPLDLSSTTRQYPPAPPSPQQTYGELMQKRAQIGSPIPIRDAGGKMDPKYRMGIGARIAGTLANFGSGLSGHGVVANVGPGATNSRYSQDEAQRQGNVENLDTQIKQQKDLGEENRKLFESANKQAYDQQIGAARGETAAAQQETASARSSLAEEKAKHDRAEETRKAQEDQNTPAQNARPSLQKNPATGKVELMVKTKGGQMVPYTPKTAEEGALLGDPNARAMFNYMHRKSGGKDENNQELNGLSPAEQRDFKNRTKLNDKKIDSLMGARRDAVLFKQDTNGIDKQLADAQGERDQVRDDILSHRKGGKLQGEAAQRQTSNTQTGRQKGDIVTVKGQKIKITKILPGGKYEGSPAP
ncbi:MAG TPA: hypothetical protein VGQ12_07575 [Candidatus Angelobacter sp.]|nr:hypothetical protein [Candidatus Angelobacter sp.]